MTYNENGMKLGTVGVMVEIDPASVLLLAVALTLPVLCYCLLKNI
jgi:hypothetical protein